MSRCFTLHLLPPLNRPFPTCGGGGGGGDGGQPVLDSRYSLDSFYFIHALSLRTADRRESEPPRADRFLAK